MVIAGAKACSLTHRRFNVAHLLRGLGLIVKHPATNVILGKMIIQMCIMLDALEWSNRIVVFRPITKTSISMLKKIKRNLRSMVLDIKLKLTKYQLPKHVFTTSWLHHKVIPVVKFTLESLTQNQESTSISVKMVWKTMVWCQKIDTISGIMWRTERR